MYGQLHVLFTTMTHISSTHDIDDTKNALFDFPVAQNIVQLKDKIV